MGADHTAAQPDSPARLHAIVRGIVQGVNYRAATQRQAQSLRLVGWVKNRYDGAVEVLAEGPRPALDELLRFLRRGPRAASVTDVQADWMPASGEFHEFDIRW